VSAGLKSAELSEKVDSDGFTMVSHKKKPSLAASVATTTKNKQRRQPLIGVRNCVSLPVISKKERSRALFVSRFSPEVTTVEIEESLKEQLSLKRLVCTRLKTKFDTYASFHVLVNEDDFPLVNNIGVWPNGCLIAPFFARLTPEQIYSADALTVSVSSKQTTETSLACNSDEAAGGSSERPVRRRNPSNTKDVFL
jgi:hypothetical protein